MTDSPVSNSLDPEPGIRVIDFQLLRIGEKDPFFLTTTLIS